MPRSPQSNHGTRNILVTYPLVKMKPPRSLPVLLVVLLMLSAGLLAAPAHAQEVVPAPDPRPSPMYLARVTLDDGTYVKVHYSSPRMRGRTIFGDLVPYGEVWRTAANEGSEITLTDDLLVAGERLPAGTYTLFTVPGEQTWQVMFNSLLGQNGTARYSAANDVLTVEVPAQTMEDTVYEAFTIAFEEAEGGADLVMMWDQTKVAVPLRQP